MIRNQNWKNDNSEKIREQDEIYRKNNPEREVKKQEKQRETHREEMSQRDRERWHSQRKNLNANVVQPAAKKPDQ